MAKDYLAGDGEAVLMIFYGEIDFDFVGDFSGLAFSTYYCYSKAVVGATLIGSSLMLAGERPVRLIDDRFLLLASPLVW